MSGTNGHSTPAPFPAVTNTTAIGPVSDLPLGVTIPTAPKKRRSRKANAELREWELWLDDGTIGRFVCDEAEAQKRLAEVPMPWREKCRLRDIKR